MSKILNPVLNNQVRETPPLKLPNGVSTIYVNVDADRDLIVTLLQSFNNNETFEKIEVRQYTAGNGDQTFNFDKVGQDVILSLENVSGADCSFTRALLDFKDSALNINDVLSHTKLDTLNANILLLTQSMVNLQKQSPVYYRDLGDAYYAFCPEFTTSTTDNAEFVAFNPVNSGKTAYLYHISFSSKAPVLTEDYNVTVKMDKITDIVGGIDLTPFQKGNLNLGLDTQSGLILRTKPQSLSGVSRILNKRLEKNGDTNIISFQHEFIEIPPGHGVSFTVISTSSTVNMTFNLRYFEEAENAPQEIELRSIIPDVDPEGNSIRTGQSGLNVYTWEFTTSDETVYDLFTTSNNFTLADDENITKLYLASDEGQVNLLLNNIVVSTGGISVNAEGEMIFAPAMQDPTNPQANITLAPNTTYIFKSRTLFNDSDEMDADIRLAIVERYNGGLINLNYVSVVIAQ
jgi:hypothetical protein